MLLVFFFFFSFFEIMTQFPTHDLIYLSFTSRIGLIIAEYRSFSFLELSCIHFKSSVYIRAFIELIVIYRIIVLANSFQLLL